MRYLDKKTEQLPRMKLVRQHFQATDKVDFRAEVDRQWKPIEGNKTSQRLNHAYLCTMIKEFNVC